MSTLPKSTHLHDLVRGDRVMLDGAEQTITSDPRRVHDGAVEFTTDLNPRGFYLHPSRTPMLVVLL